MSRYCKRCNEDKPRSSMTLYFGKLICQCDKGLPPLKVGIKKEVK